MNEEIEPSIPRSVVVTGASRGLGEAVAKEFLAQGDRVAGISRSGEATDGVLGLAADVTDPEALAQALSVATEAHGTVEVLVASAGVNRESLAARTSSQMWDEVISADLTGTFNTVRAVTPAMMRARRGRIILVSSVIAARGGVGLSAYGAAKGRDGVIVFTTQGTGIGSAIIVNGTLLTNTELGHLEIDGHDAEKMASSGQKTLQGLNWEQWAQRLQRYYGHVEFLLNPDLFVVGGGVSENHEKFMPLLDLKTPMIPAKLLNTAGIVGAAYYAAKHGA